MRDEPTNQNLHLSAILIGRSTGWSGPDDLLAGRDRVALLTRDAQMLSKVNSVRKLEGQNKEGILVEGNIRGNERVIQYFRFSAVKTNSVILQEEVEHRLWEFLSGSRSHSFLGSNQPALS